MNSPKPGQQVEKTMTDEDQVIIPEIEAEIDNQAALAEADVQPTDTVPPVVVPARELTDAEIDAEIAKRGYVRPQPVQQTQKQESNDEAYERIKNAVIEREGYADPLLINKLYADHQHNQLVQVVQSQQDFTQTQAVMPQVYQALEDAGVPKEQAQHYGAAKAAITREQAVDSSGRYNPVIHQQMAEALLIGMHYKTQGRIGEDVKGRKPQNPQADGGAPAAPIGLGLSGQESKDYNSWHEMWYAGKPKTAATVKQYRELDN